MPINFSSNTDTMLQSNMDILDSGQNMSGTIFKNGGVEGKQSKLSKTTFESFKGIQTDNVKLITGPGNAIKSVPNISSPIGLPSKG